MNLAIYGAGSLGTVLGAFLAKSGIDVDLISRNQEHVNGLNTKGAQIVGNISLTVPVKALTPQKMFKKYDYIFLMTKQLDNEDTVNFLKRFLSTDGIICTFQNGIPEYKIASIIGEDKTYGCAVAWGATLIGNGVCELTSDPKSLTFSLGQFGRQNSVKLNQIKNILENAGHVDIESNFIGARWSKLLINSSFSGMSAVLGCTFGEAAKNRASRTCIQKIMKECIDVAKSVNVKMEKVQGTDIAKVFDYHSKIKELISFLIIPLAIKKHASLKASMLQDLEKGKKTEVDSINGIISEIGKKNHLATPYNDKVIQIIHDIELGKRCPSYDNLSLFDF